MMHAITLTLHSQFCQIFRALDCLPKAVQDKVFVFDARFYQEVSVKEWPGDF
jgi:hypothetical protein